MLNCLVKNISHEATLDIRGRLFLFVTKYFGNISSLHPQYFPKETYEISIFGGCPHS